MPIVVYSTVEHGYLENNLSRVEHVVARKSINVKRKLVIKNCDKKSKHLLKKKCICKQVYRHKKRFKIGRTIEKSIQLKELRAWMWRTNVSVDWTNLWLMQRRNSRVDWPKFWSKQQWKFRHFVSPYLNEDLVDSTEWWNFSAYKRFTVCTENNGNSGSESGLNGSITAGKTRGKLTLGISHCGEIHIVRPLLAIFISRRNV